MIEAINRLMRPIRQRVMLLLGRGVIEAAKASGGLPELVAQMFDGEIAEKLTLLQQFGFASLPVAGGEALVVFPGGDRNLGYVVATDDRRYRPILAAGEVALYSEEDRLAEGEELPEVPEGAPAGWPAMPEDPEAAGPALCRIHLKAGREIEITAAKLTINALTGISLCSPSIKVGPPGAQVEIGGGGEEEGRPLARLGDCVDVAAGSSEGRWPIVGSCE